ncbi:spore germination protein [Mesobacillus subterraneus]|uniref:Spore germination protein n=1 Tax=Mesobacillus subterraneus TaxID=285983 RepID=A0A427TLF2_9BACI|nr:spore germination protein [Mesobacillus subterraneus]RSD25173.1 spore germination protein [Mesobacillus subterraneus]
MFFKKKKADILNSMNKKNLDDMELIPVKKEDFIQRMKDLLHHSADLHIKELQNGLTLVYVDTITDNKMINEDVLARLEDAQPTPDDALKRINVGSSGKLKYVEEIIDKILKGSVIIHSDGYPIIVEAAVGTQENRSLTRPENESQVLGPQLAFNESLATNISLIRRYLTNPNLCNESFTLGKQTNSGISLLYLKDIADEEMVERMRKRIQKIDVDSILDSSTLVQLVEDNSLAIFPQLLMTERPDRACAWLLNGKVAVLVDGSVQVIGAPLSFFEFFQSMEDESVRWQIATFLRLLRIFSMIVSIFFTAIYVAALTFHYEIIPQTLLIPLGESRSLVPFPPIFEALLLEIMIELLREAGARLPTKVGQTMGIVGGIVVGTAAVDAGFTSNILIIIIAVSALASFTTPNYMMGNVIRILRFPLILLAGFWGFYGLMIGFCFLLIHLIKQESLGTPFLAPFYPPRFSDWPDSIIRFPLAWTNKRPHLTRPRDRIKFQTRKSKE